MYERPQPLPLGDEALAYTAAHNPPRLDTTVFYPNAYLLAMQRCHSQYILSLEPFGGDHVLLPISGGARLPFGFSILIVL